MSDTAGPPAAGAISALVRAIESEFAANPPTLCLIGLSGVGKSSTINAMFGTNLAVSATTRGTSRFSARTFDIISRRTEAAPVTCKLKVYDAPGLGEDETLDANYLERYRTHLPKCDVALWVVAARNRALALDQRYLAQLSDKMPNLVIAINQVDLVDPLDWNTAINMPSHGQADAIAIIARDRHEKLSRYMTADCPVIAYSAQRFYNLQALFTTCLKAAPKNRRWMFELLKSFSTRDWLAQAKGLSPTQRAALAEKYIASDSAITLDQLAGRV